MTNAIKFC